MSRKGQTLLAGHTLVWEGAAHDVEGQRLRQGTREGRAKCSCGTLSEVLPGTAARRRWHAARKDEVRLHGTDPVAAFLTRVNAAQAAVEALKEHPRVGVAGTTSIAIWQAADAMQDVLRTIDEYRPQVVDL